MEMQGQPQNRAGETQKGAYMLILLPSKVKILRLTLWSTETNIPTAKA
jgi:hypothetical protein